MKRRFNRRFEKDRTPSSTVVEQFRAAFPGLREVRDKDVEEDDGLGLVHFRGTPQQLFHWPTSPPLSFLLVQPLPHRHCVTTEQLPS